MPEGIPGHSCSPEVVLGHHRNSQYVPVFTSQVQCVLCVEVVLKTSWDIPRCPRVFLGLLGRGARDCQSLGHHGISGDVPGYSWDYLDLGQVIVRAWDIPGYPEMSQGILGTTWTWDK